MVVVAWQVMQEVESHWTSGRRLPAATAPAGPQARPTTLQTCFSSIDAAIACRQPSHADAQVRLDTFQPRGCRGVSFSLHKLDDRPSQKYQLLGHSEHKLPMFMHPEGPSLEQMDSLCTTSATSSRSGRSCILSCHLGVYVTG